jgi:hypothetical protein
MSAVVRKDTDTAAGFVSDGYLVSEWRTALKEAMPELEPCFERQVAKPENINMPFLELMEPCFHASKLRDKLLIAFVTSKAAVLQESKAKVLETLRGAFFPLVIAELFGEPSQYTVSEFVIPHYDPGGTVVPAFVSVVLNGSKVDYVLGWRWSGNDWFIEDIASKSELLSTHPNAEQEAAGDTAAPNEAGGQSSLSGSREPAVRPESTKSDGKGSSNSASAKIWLYLSGSAAGIGAATGIATLFAASTAKNNCSGNVCSPSARHDLDRANLFAKISNVSFGAAGILGLVSLIVYLDTPTADASKPASAAKEKQSSSYHITPFGSQSTIGVEGSFP